jgi:hypothetical protein
MQTKSIEKDFQRQSGWETFESWIIQNCPAEIGMCQVDSPVSLIVSPGKDKAVPISAIFGLSVGGCYANYDPERHCLKTLQDSLLLMEDGFSMELCRTFTKAGMMRNGRIFPLLTWEHGISATGSGLSVTDEKKPLWPTPKAQNKNGAVKHGEGGLDLQTAVLLWPTPTVNGNNNRKGASKKAGDGLATAVRLWPTPRTAGMCGGTGNWEQLKNKCTDIEEARKMGAGNGGQLNPDWVEALMGYPQGWTDIDAEAAADADYSARWLDGTWEDGIPRIVSGVKNRIARLKCLGNTVVPQIPAYLWALVKAALWA